MLSWPPARRGMEVHCIYAIRSLSSNRLYVGQTCDVNRRVIEHNKGWIKRMLKKSRARRKKWLERYPTDLKGLDKRACHVEHAYGSESEFSQQTHQH